MTPRVYSHIQVINSKRPLIAFLTIKIICILVLTLGSFFVNPAYALSPNQQIQTIKSRHDFNSTLSKLKQGIQAMGANLFAEIDHHQGALSIKVTMPPNTLLIFGKPQLGTPIMQHQPSMGLDLPLRLSVYQDLAGEVYISYRSLEVSGQDHTPPLPKQWSNKPDLIMNKLVTSAAK